MKRLLFCLTVLFASLAGCQTNPITGRNQLLVHSNDEMNLLGEATYKEMTGAASKAKIIKSGPGYEALQRVGKNLQAVASDPEFKGVAKDFKWEFTLIKSFQVNAWALPGGKIAFYTGIFPILKDEAGMAIVMGHELMHAMLWHGNERMSQGAVANIAVGAAAIGLHDSEYRNEIVGALGATLNVAYIMPYSRDHESEADVWGLYLAAKAGYDPETAIRVWETMDKLSAGKRPPEILSTHPEPKNRIKAMRAAMPRAQEYYREAIRKNAGKPAPNHKLPTSSKR